MEYQNSDVEMIFIKKKKNFKISEESGKKSLTVYKILIVLSFLLLYCPYSYSQKKPVIDYDSCTYNGFKLYGRVKFVDSFPDIKVQIVDSFPDLKVKIVNSFPDECGKWMIVDSFPDIKVKIVESFPDIKIKFVESFPGKP